MNELEKAIEKLQYNTNDCCKDYRHLGFWKVAREGGKDELIFMVENTEDFEDATMWLNPKDVKMNLSCLNEQKKSQLHDFINLQGKSVKGC